MKLTVLSGGTGTPKLLSGLLAADKIDESDLTVVVNTGDDLEISGNLVCPDLDSVLYTLAGIIDEDRWWGIAGDTYSTHERVLELSTRRPSRPYLSSERQADGRRLATHRRFSGIGEFMSFGDLDRATHVVRTALLDQEATLTGATASLVSRMGISAAILPMSDDPVATLVHTRAGETLHFQEYWVGRRGGDPVAGVEFRGVDRACPTEAVVEALRHPVIIGPSNPVTSVGPILALPDVRRLLQETTVLAVSPFLGDQAFSGPADDLMAAQGNPPGTAGLRACYEGFLDGILADVSDNNAPASAAFRTDIAMPDLQGRVRVAAAAVDAVTALAQGHRPGREAVQ